jgi:hypothetical protein
MRISTKNEDMRVAIQCDKQTYDEDNINSNDGEERRYAKSWGFQCENRHTYKASLDLGLYSAGNYRTGHLPRRGLVDFTTSQISPITL